MKILLDEQVPLPVLEPLRHLLHPSHKIDHVDAMGWKSKPDLNLIPDLRARNYVGLVTADLSQLENPDEVRVIHRTGIHHIRFRQYGKGIHKTASAIATIFAGLPAALAALEQATGQRLVQLKLVKSGDIQLEIIDPSVTPPNQYWPHRKMSGRHRPAGRS
jgi:hypothetical protein